MPNLPVQPLGSQLQQQDQEPFASPPKTEEPSGDDTAHREVRVLVTGFGPWGNHGTNPSSEIVKILPPSITFSLPSSTSMTAATTAVKVNIIPHPDIPVSYAHIPSLIPHLLETHKPDLIVHIGLYAGRGPIWSIDRSAPTGEFLSKDIEGKSNGPIDPDTIKPLGDLNVSGQYNHDNGYTHHGGKTINVNGSIQRKDEVEGEGGITTAKGIEHIQTGLNHSQIVQLWKTHCQDLTTSNGQKPDVRATDQVGDFLCGFIYFHTLLYDSPKKRVVFMHIPECRSIEEVELGREITVGLVRAMVESYLGGERSEQLV